MPSFCSYAGVDFTLALSDVAGFLERELPLFDQWLEESPPAWGGKNLFGLARPNWLNMMPVRPGQYFYPTGASRWSIFRAIITSDLVEEMADLALPSTGAAPQTFILNANPTLSDGRTYGIGTNLYMLPPRTLAVHGTEYVGLFILELVDERYLWSSWNSLESFAPDSESELVAIFFPRSPHNSVITADDSAFPSSVNG